MGWYMENNFEKYQKTATIMHSGKKINFDGFGVVGLEVGIPKIHKQMPKKHSDKNPRRNR
jgi:hypothetical protein